MTQALKHLPSIIQTRFLSRRNHCATNWEHWDWKKEQHKKNTHDEDKPDTNEDSTRINGLTSDQVKKALKVLEKYAVIGRRKRFEEVLDNRTNFISVAFENPSNFQNVFAALRTGVCVCVCCVCYINLCITDIKQLKIVNIYLSTSGDCFGIQNIEVITAPVVSHFKSSASMASSLGAAKWLTLSTSDSVDNALLKWRSKGYRIAASYLSDTTNTADDTPVSMSVFDVDWNSQPTLIVLGNEEKGVSDKLKRSADFGFHLPMKGFAQSLNLSAFFASMCSILQLKGALRRELSFLTVEEKQRILLLWYLRSVRNSVNILKVNSLDLGELKIYPKVFDHYSARP